MNSSFYKKISGSHFIPKQLPGEEEIENYVDSLLQFLFPELNDIRLSSKLEIETELGSLKVQFEKLLYKTQACHEIGIQSICSKYHHSLEDVYDRCIEDADAILAGDPAAVDRKEVIRAYPGFFAITVYRIAHLMLDLGIPYLPRIFTEYAHSKTGIDIHPGAEIGRRFCIDHGTGVVIGQTSIIGDDVKLYQGVTLGALSVSRKMAEVKRHPTIEDNVIIYSGATILGGGTVIGVNSIIGGNVWITESVKPNSRIYYDSKHSLKIKEIEKVHE